MVTVVLILGGASSGKSLWAETRTLAFPGRPIYIATAEARDGEMSARIAKHRTRRGDAWDDIEVPLDLAAAVAGTDGRGARLVDCLTIWLSNLMHADRDWREEASQLVDVLRQQRSPVVLVANEVGLGIVPANELARSFRDVAGTLNQMLAQTAGEVEFVVAGLPIKVK